MAILNISQLSKKQIEDIKNLEILCKEKENLQGSIFLSNDLNYDREFPCFFLLYQDNILISFLSLFLPTKEEAEVYAYTHPDFRQLGAFNSLLEDACKLLQDFSIPSILFVTEPNGKAARETLNTLETNFLYSEYLLSLKNPIEGDYEGTLLPASIKDLDTLSKLHSQIFNSDTTNSFSFLESSFQAPNIISFKYMLEDKLIGLCHATIEESFVSIFGVGISPDFQDHHYGKAMMLQLIKKLNRYQKPITLEVNSENKKAFHLYEGLGFVITSQFDYYYSDTADILDSLI